MIQVSWEEPLKQENINDNWELLKLLKNILHDTAKGANSQFRKKGQSLTWLREKALKMCI